MKMLRDAERLLNAASFGNVFKALSNQFDHSLCLISFEQQQELCR